MESVTTDGGVIVFAPTEENYDTLLTAADRADMEKYTNPRRRAEVGAWRAAVRNILGTNIEIGYNDVGAPIIEKSQLLHSIFDFHHSGYKTGFANDSSSLGLNSPFIGVAHTDGMASVIVATHLCAIDIEPITRNFTNAAQRYLSAAERAMFTATTEMCAAWCIKETLYKYARRSGIDFARDIVIENIDFDGGIARAVMFGIPHSISLICYKKYIATYLITD